MFKVDMLGIDGILRLGFFNVLFSNSSVINSCQQIKVIDVKQEEKERCLKANFYSDFVHRRPLGIYF